MDRPISTPPVGFAIETVTEIKLDELRFGSDQEIVAIVVDASGAEHELRVGDTVSLKIRTEFGTQVS